MYVVEDRVTPSVTGYLNGQKTKNTFLRHWPQVILPGTNIPIFAKLYYYVAGNILKTDSHLKLYKLLNIKVEDLEQESYEGVQDAYFYLMYQYVDLESIDVGSLENYVETSVLLTVDTDGDTIEDASTWRTENLVYNPPAYTVGSEISDAELIDEVLNASPNIWYEDETADSMTALALLDSEGALFERRVTIVNRSVNTKISKQFSLDSALTEANSRYLISANFKFMFRRIAEVTDPAADAFLRTIEDRARAINNFSALPSVKSKVSNILTTTEQLEYSGATSINSQIINMFLTIKPPLDTSVNYGLLIRSDGMADLTGREFSIAIGKFIKSGFTKEEVDSWKKALNVVIIVVVIVVAVYTGGAATTGLSGLSAVMAFSAAAASVLTVGMFLQTGLALYFQSQGDMAAAAYVGGTMQVLGTLSMVFGVMTVVGSFTQQLMTQTGKATVMEAIKQASLSDVGAVVKNMVVGGVQSSTSSMMSNGMKMVTTAFDYYQKNVDPPYEGIDEQQQMIKEQEKELEDYSSPDNMRKVQYVMDSPHSNPYDMNEYMQNIPYIMTEGKIKGTYTKYYNG